MELLLLLPPKEEGKPLTGYWKNHKKVI